MNNKEELVIKWKIENFHMFPHQYGECIKSPIIVINHLFNTKWCLVLYPRGFDKHSRGYISCYFVRCDNADLEFFKIYCKLSVNSVEIDREINCGRRQKWGTSLFLRRESILNHKDPLEVACRLKIIINYTGLSDVNNHGISIPFTASNDQSHDRKILKSTYTNKKLELNPFLPRSQARETTSTDIDQCFIHSQVTGQKCSFTCPIKDLEFDDENKMDLSLARLNFFDEIYLSTKLFLKTSDGNTYLHTDIYLETEVEFVFAFCTIQILNSSGEVCDTFKDEHLFEKEDQGDVWHFAHPFNWSNVTANENSEYFSFEISVSEGQMLSDVEWLVNVNYNTDYSAPKCAQSGFPEEVFQFYKEEKFCDVTLRTVDGTFQCHKTVLCAMSPVFAAMFESGMRETDTKVVQMDDLDSDTVSRMLVFMYTSTAEELEFNNAMDLFSAADKYQIDSLKRICGDFLKKNLNHGNVCEILNFSDARNDVNLKHSAVEYISTYRSEILNSSQWKELAAKNLTLAYQIVLTLVPDTN